MSKLNQLLPFAMSPEQTDIFRDWLRAHDKGLFEALKNVWLHPPVDRAEDYRWSANDIIESLDLLEAEWLDDLS